MREFKIWIYFFIAMRYSVLLLFIDLWEYIYPLRKSKNLILEIGQSGIIAQTSGNSICVQEFLLPAKSSGSLSELIPLLSWESHKYFNDLRGIHLHLWFQNNKLWSHKSGFSIQSHQSILIRFNYDISTEFWNITYESVHRYMYWHNIRCLHTLWMHIIYKEHLPVWIQRAPYFPRFPRFYRETFLNIKMSCFYYLPMCNTIKTNKKSYFLH